MSTEGPGKVNEGVVAILGVGPSGLAAALAVLQAGSRVHLYSKRIEPSHLYGCQYLHEPIPGITLTGYQTVEYTLLGEPEDYRAKVYGDAWKGTVSPEDLEQEHKAWDLRWAYRQMWSEVLGPSQYVRRVELRRAEISWRWLAEKSTILNTYDRVISTIPATAMCAYGHSFESHSIWAVGSKHPDPTKPRAEVVCDGTGDVDWYRKATVFGYETTEWSTKPEGVAAAKVLKPLRTNCTCWPDIIRAGRYGRWAKGILVHHAYQQAQYVMHDVLGDKLPNTAQICRNCGRWGEKDPINERLYSCSAGHLWNTTV